MLQVVKAPTDVVFDVVWVVAERPLQRGLVPVSRPVPMVTVTPATVLAGGVGTVHSPSKNLKSFVQRMLTSNFVSDTVFTLHLLWHLQLGHKVQYTLRPLHTHEGCIKASF